VKRFFKRFAQDDSGSSIITFTVALPVVLSALGVSIEAGYFMKTKKDYQLTADLAAYAGTLEIQNDNDIDVVKMTKLDALNNGYEFARGQIIVNSPPSSGNYTTEDAVEVIINQKGDQYFSNLIGKDRINYKVRSVVALTGDESICILALNPTETRAFNLAGSSVTNVNECTVGVNSAHSTGARVAGTASLTMECLQVVGDIYIGNSATVNPNCDAIKTGTDAIENPFEYLTAPNLATYPSACSTPAQISANEWAMSPGRYCADVAFNTLVRMAPGTYVMDGADLKLYGGGAHLQGDGVTIILMNGGSMTSLNGGAKIELSAPKTGDYQGVAVFSDPVTQPSGAIIKINGNADSAVEGLMYFPNQQLEYGGNATSASECTLLVADKIELTGSAEFKTTSCKTTFGIKPPGNIRVAVVE
jgi:Flp pilus assembly protein TadG